MKKVPQKVFIALDSINNSLKAILEYQKRGRAHELFFILDTLLYFEGSIRRSIEKGDFEKLLADIRTSMRIYAEFIDGKPNVTLENVKSTIEESKLFLSLIIDTLRAS